MIIVDTELKLKEARRALKVHKDCVKRDRKRVEQGLQPIGWAKTANSRQMKRARRAIREQFGLI